MVSGEEGSLKDENQDSSTGNCMDTSAGNCMDTSAISLRLGILDEAQILGER